MVTREAFKKTFWAVFIIIFIIITVFVGKAVYSAIYESEVRKVLSEKGIDTGDLTSDEIRQIADTKELNIKITNDVFVCENDNSIQSRAYIILLGFGNHDKDSFSEENKIILKDPKVKGLLTYDYDEKLILEEISKDFVKETNKFLEPLDVEELIIVGTSAGGTVAAYSLHKLDFPGIIELHTIASPLRGCNNKGFREQFVKGEGFWREIGIGLDPFVTPSTNYKAYHHKTIEDSALNQCDTPVEMQYNNLEASKEFYYPEHNHESIMSAVLKLIIDCHQ